MGAAVQALASGKESKRGGRETIPQQGLTDHNSSLSYWCTKFRPCDEDLDTRTIRVAGDARIGPLPRPVARDDERLGREGVSLEEVPPWVIDGVEGGGAGPKCAGTRRRLSPGPGSFQDQAQPDPACTRRSTFPCGLRSGQTSLRQDKELHGATGMDGTQPNH